MRIALVILAMSAVAVGMIHLRRAETRACHEIYRLQLRQVRLRCRVYEQQATLGRLTAPNDVRQRAEKMDVGLTWTCPTPQSLAERPVERPAEPRRAPRLAPRAPRKRTGR